MHLWAGRARSLNADIWPDHSLRPHNISPKGKNAVQLFNGIDVGCKSNNYSREHLHYMAMPLT